MTESAPSPQLQIIHVPSGTVLAEGPQGWGGIFSCEGNLYVPRQMMCGHYCRHNFILGFGWIRGLYVWMNLVLDGQHETSFMAWQPLLPNPMFWFLMFKIGFDPRHPELQVRQVTASAAQEAERVGS
ncbi:MAG: hypothetical protein KC474_01825 [Cyanobacteria bacterium HKST-UBA04]|nr:hypothetical protein [Cyanobacteria bacterium HKST-UBA04]MCA9842314.1 hypothetical protein [Cyanobacteria bacterium HKST-UBA03]